MDERTQVMSAAHELAAAIGKRDSDAVARLLAPGFLLRTPGGLPVGLADFIAGIRQLPEGIEFVKLRDLEVDLQDGQAIATGIQHARVRMDGQTFDELKPFVDWFVRDGSGRWQVRVALELPAFAPDADVVRDIESR